MKTIVAMHQDQGDREYQQDAMAIKSFGRSGTLCILADGMGGYEGGEIASGLIAETFRNMSIDSDDIGATLKKNLILCNEAIAAYKKTHREVKNMGSTVIAFFITESSFQWISVGDSPLYIIRSNTIKRVNKNHSISGLLELQFKKGEISKKELDENPNKHMLTSAVTGEEIAEIDLSKEYQLTERCIFILASDGIETLTEDEINKIVQQNIKRGTQKDLNAAAKALVDAVLAKKKPHQDNVTVILVSQEANEPQSIENIADMEDKVSNDKKKNIFKHRTLYILLAIFLVIGFVFWLLFSNMISELISDTNKTKKSTAKQIINDDMNMSKSFGLGNSTKKINTEIKDSTPRKDKRETPKQKNKKTDQSKKDQSKTALKSKAIEKK